MPEAHVKKSTRRVTYNIRNYHQFSRNLSFKLIEKDLFQLKKVRIVFLMEDAFWMLPAKEIITGAMFSHHGFISVSPEKKINVKNFVKTKMKKKFVCSNFTKKWLNVNKIYESIFFILSYYMLFTIMYLLFQS